ncbi:hypothetical protein CCO03_05425 [Comamonas serinivorans]|uniref:Uncharacterized protein n=1 Tax=Comamonas serinivorans TaxID=1082851 RepID=A0A1Y0ELL0_9BURK|nr:hypothetical protein CCO03_05425 [Comamonas serinivorans]
MERAVRVGADGPHQACGPSVRPARGRCACPTSPSCVSPCLEPTRSGRAGKKIKGFDRSDAVLTGVEARTSSPVQFARDEASQCLPHRG